MTARRPVSLGEEDFAQDLCRPTGPPKPSEVPGGRGRKWLHYNDLWPPPGRNSVVTGPPGSIRARSA